MFGRLSVSGLHLDPDSLKTDENRLLFPSSLI